MISLVHPGHIRLKIVRKTDFIMPDNRAFNRLPTTSARTFVGLAIGRLSYCKDTVGAHHISQRQTSVYLRSSIYYRIDRSHSYHLTQQYISDLSNP